MYSPFSPSTMRRSKATHNCESDDISRPTWWLVSKSNQVRSTKHLFGPAARHCTGGKYTSHYACARNESKCSCIFDEERKMLGGDSEGGRGKWGRRKPGRKVRGPSVWRKVVRNAHATEEKLPLFGSLGLGSTRRNPINVTSSTPPILSGRKLLAPYPADEKSTYSPRWLTDSLTN